jgi:hypothetical protein
VLHIFELLIDNRNEDINENEARNHHEENPEKVADNPGLVTVMHESVPRLASRRSKQRDHRRVECPKSPISISPKRFIAAIANVKMIKPKSKPTFAML